MTTDYSIPAYACVSWVAGDYLSKLQRGLQTGHVIHTLVEKYILSPYYTTDDAVTTLKTWITDPNPYILINTVGNQAGVMQQADYLAKIATVLSLPMAKFAESQDAMNSMVTAVGMIVPLHEYRDPALFEVKPGMFSPYAFIAPADRDRVSMDNLMHELSTSLPGTSGQHQIASYCLHQLLMRSRRA